MKKLSLIFAALSISLLCGFTTMDVIDPIGSDDWKTVKLDIVMEDGRSLPNWENYSYSSFLPQVVLTFGSKSKTIKTPQIPDGNTTRTKISIPAAGSNNYSVQFKTDFRYASDLSATLVRGELVNGVKQLEVRLKRIDVKHMLVTREDGSKYITEDGHADIYLLWMDGNRERSNRFVTGMPTGYGVDVPRGYRYRIHVTADTEDGEDEFTANLDFR